MLHENGRGKLLLSQGNHGLFSWQGARNFLFFGTLRASHDVMPFSMAVSH
jgi:hypothetical protein